MDKKIKVNYITIQLKYCKFTFLIKKKTIYK